MDIKISDSFKERLLHGLQESEFKELGLKRNPFIPFIPQEIMTTFVNREEEKKLLIRYLPELVQGFIPLLVLTGSKGIGKTHFLNYVYNQLKVLEKDLGHEVRCLDSDNIKAFFNGVAIGEINKPQLVMLDDTEKIWDNHKQDLVKLLESPQHNVKFICVWNGSKWAQTKNDSFYASLKPVTIKVEKLSREHLITMIRIRLAPIVIGERYPISDGALALLANVADGVPYTMVYFAEKLLHHALDKKKVQIDEDLTKEFIGTLGLRQFNLGNLTRTQWKVLKILLKITHSKKRGATSSEVAEQMDASRPAAIQHLKELRNQGMIEEKTEDKKNHYYIKPAILGQVELYASEEEIL